ncbi:MAG: hypothetical protein H6627_14350 [Calditrichae bacterium]|nr:hypothetical protein [Calditrichia bacterium]
MKTLIIFLLIIAAANVQSQSLESRLNDAYNNFNNTRVDSLLDQAAVHVDSFPSAEKVAFHKYSAFRAFRENRGEQVTAHFRELITINPAYVLDPVTTSPKLIMMFDKAKIEYLEKQQKRLNDLSRMPAAEPFPWRSVTFPGLEQWHRGAKTKGLIWGAAGLVTLTGTLQAVIRTASSRQEYLDAADTQAATNKYKSYNDLYRSQYYWAYGLCVVWIANYFDAVYLTENLPAAVSFGMMDQQTAAVTLRVHF